MSNVIRDMLAEAGACVELFIGKPQNSEHYELTVRDETALRAFGIDVLINKAVFGTPEQQRAARWLVWELGQTLGVHPSSIHELYIARGRNALPHTFTTPAMNIRIMSYDSMRAAIAAAIKGKVGAFIFEISRSEMAYTEQRPAEYTAVAIAAAIKEGFRGPLFIQGDHFQINAKKYLTGPDAEIAGLQKLMDEALNMGFYNIDIDTSTLVDLDKPTLDAQQKLNYELCALFADYIREREPAGVTVSLGGEIGEVGHKNSEVSELRAFMDGLKQHMQSAHGISKISIQTGTSHGGIVLPDGSIADVTIDFDCLRDLSEAARDEYGMGGAVQHGASTLPEQAFGKFAQAGAIEVHLATALQALAYTRLPKAMNDEMTHWLFKNEANERAAGDTDEQFLHKVRKKATGAFKRQLWGMSDGDRIHVREGLQERFAMLFNRLGVENTRSYVDSFVTIKEIHKQPEDFGAQPVVKEDVSAFAD